MKEKLLCIKRDNNVLLYKVSYDINKLKELINLLNELYSYEKNDTIETTIYRNVPLSMGIYDNLDFYHVDKKYEIIEDNPITKESRNCKLKIKVFVDSVVSNTLNDIFIKDEDVLLNLSKLYKILNHILNINNTFKFNEMIDLRNIRKKWNDLSRLILNDLEKQKYLKIMKENINVDDVVLNNREKKNEEIIYETVINNLKSILLFEQVGMFPIQEENDDLLKIFEMFGERNKSFEFYFGSLENAKINMNGGIYINNISDKVIRTYHKDTEKVKDNTYFELIKSKYIV